MRMRRSATGAKYGIGGLSEETAVYKPTGITQRTEQTAGGSIKTESRGSDDSEMSKNGKSQSLHNSALTSGCIESVSSNTAGRCGL